MTQHQFRMWLEGYQVECSTQQFLSLYCRYGFSMEWDCLIQDVPGLEHETIMMELDSPDFDEEEFMARPIKSIEFPQDPGIEGGEKH